MQVFAAKRFPFLLDGSIVLYLKFSQYNFLAHKPIESSYECVGRIFFKKPVTVSGSI